MKNIYLKPIFILLLAAGLFTSCVNEDDYEIPTIKQLILNEGFETSPTGFGSTEVPISLEGWANFNTSNTKLWHARSFSSNNHAEFSSFYSAAGSSDAAWLITPALDLSTTSSEVFEFGTKVRFYTGAALTVLISEDYDGTQAGIATATWTTLNPTLPTAEQETFLSSGIIDLSAYNSSNVRIAFKYTGSKAGVTTTFQIDNIKVFENL